MYFTGCNMTARTKLPRPEEVQDYPDNKKAVMVRAGGKIRVVEKMISWDEEKQSRVEKRTYLGYVVDGRYYSNASYKKAFKNNVSAQTKKASASRSKPAKDPDEPQDSFAADCYIERLLHADAVPLLHAVARDTGLVEDLKNAFGRTHANLLLSMAFQWLITKNHSAPLFSSWQTNMLLPFSKELSDRYMADFLSMFAEMPAAMESFFLARLHRLKEKELLVFDATKIASGHVYRGNTSYWPEEDGPAKKNVILLLSHATHMPVLFKILPDWIHNICTYQDQIFSFDELSSEDKQDKQISYAIIDIASFSLDNIASFIDQKRRIVMPARYTAGSWIEEIIDNARLTPAGGAGWEKAKDCWCKTVPVQKTFADGKKRKLWVHVYYSEKQKEIMVSQLLLQLRLFEDMWPYASPDEDEIMDDNSLRNNSLMEYFVRDSGIPGKEAPVRDEEAIARETSDYGFFAIVSTMECSAADVLESVDTRGPIIQAFESDIERVPEITALLFDPDTDYGHMLIAFVALTMLTHIKNKMQLETVVRKDGKTETLPPLSDEYSASDVISLFSCLSVVVCQNGTRLWQHAYPKVHEIALRLGYPDLFKKIPTWA